MQEEFAYTANFLRESRLFLGAGKYKTSLVSVLPLLIAWDGAEGNFFIYILQNLLLSVLQGRKIQILLPQHLLRTQ